MSAEQVTAVAHGKINLHLGVGDVRADGYHNLETIFQSVDLREQVQLTIADGWSIEVQGLDAHLVPTDASNLAQRAVELVREEAGGDAAGLPKAHVAITKGVPVAGGMAGGSADAAAALIAALRLYELQRSPAQIAAMALRLGADVPFCVLGGTALAYGVGEQLAPIPVRGQLHWAIATDKRGLSTPSVFHQLDALRARHLERGTAMARAGAPTALQQALLSGDAQAVAPLLANDLQPAALSLLPSLRQTMAAAAEAGALASIVSGSGPTIAMLCANAEQAVEVAAAVNVAGSASATTVTSSPSGGARIIEPGTQDAGQ